MRAITDIRYSKTNKMDLFHKLFILVKHCTCFGGLSVHHQELKTAHTATGLCQIEIRVKGKITSECVYRL
jgi:hypothetical protein